MSDTKSKDKIVEEFCDRLLEGNYVAAICRQPDMPDKKTLWRWCKADPELAARIDEAAEAGYYHRAELVVVAAKNAADPLKGRLAFDAERWLLGKVSRRFADKPVLIDARSVIADGDAFAAISETLERAAAAIASGGAATLPVALPGPPGPSDTAGGMAAVDATGGQGMGED